MHTLIEEVFCFRALFVVLGNGKPLDTAQGHLHSRERCRNDRVISHLLIQLNSAIAVQLAQVVFGYIPTVSNKRGDRALCEQVAYWFDDRRAGNAISHYIRAALAVAPLFVESVNVTWRYAKVLCDDRGIAPFV